MFPLPPNEAVFMAELFRWFPDAQEVPYHAPMTLVDDDRPVEAHLQAHVEQARLWEAA